MIENGKFAITYKQGNKGGPVYVFFPATCGTQMNSDEQYDQSNYTIVNVLGLYHQIEWNQQRKPKYCLEVKVCVTSDFK